MRHLNEIIIHCSATPRKWLGDNLEKQVAEIRRWHVEDNGWRDIGYHFLIGRDGHIMSGRPIGKVGAHTRGRNANSIGVCLIGGKDAAATDRFEDHFTTAQRVLLRRFVDGLKMKYGITMVSGHNQYAAKGCPGFNVPAFFAPRRLTFWQRLRRAFGG